MKFLIPITKMALIMALFTLLAYYQQWMFTLVFSGIYALYNLYRELLTMAFADTNIYLIKKKEQDDEMLMRIISDRGLDS